METNIKHLKKTNFSSSFLTLSLFICLILLTWNMINFDNIVSDNDCISDVAYQFKHTRVRDFRLSMYRFLNIILVL